MEINMKNTVKKVASLFLSYLLGSVLYILLHEFGHTIVIWAAGGKVTEFSIATAHVSSFGGAYTEGLRLWLHANGAILPVVVVLVNMFCYRKESKNTFYHMFSFVGTIMPICSLLAWVVIPFVYMNGNAPAGDDVTKFLAIFSENYSPLIVSVVALLIVISGVLLMVKKGIIKNYVLEIKKQ